MAAARGASSPLASKTSAINVPTSVLGSGSIQVSCPKSATVILRRRLHKFCTPVTMSSGSLNRS
jgi:hypothetical protein